MAILEYDKNKLIGLLTVFFPNAKIYLFGSQARDTAFSYSDIDIAIDNGKLVDPILIGEARAVINETNIVNKIDLVDFYDVPAEFQKQILDQGVLWKQ